MAWRKIEMILWLSVCLSVASCERSAEPEALKPGPNLHNPEARNLPAVRFRLSAVDTKSSRQNAASGRVSFELEYDGKGWICNGCGTELVVQPENYVLNRNFGNELIVSAVSEDADFEGVNISSSNEAVDVVWTDENRRSFRLLSRTTGTSVIKVWNGESNAMSFPVHSALAIPMTGVLVEYRGVRYELRSFSESEFARLQSQKRYAVKEWLLEDEDCFERGVDFKILGPLPLNASEHNRLSIIDESIMLGGRIFDEIWSENAEKNPCFSWFARRAGATPPMDLLIYPWELIGRDIVVFDKIGAETIKLKNFPLSPAGARSGPSTIYALCIPFSKSTYDWIMSRN